MAKRKLKHVPVLVTRRGYEGQYVAFDPAKGKKVIAHSKDAGAVVDKARKLGVNVPAVIFVPRTDVTYIY